ncbi:MAG: hypothetical protein LH679_08910 [Cyanobacteria bacterium CAN_BIN43]|nr:hypothetical protein [Cyanobacteria bacterium CAN_BIN43]
MTAPRCFFPKFQPIKIGLLSIITGLIGLALCNHVSIATSLTATPAEIYPASIPWLQDQQTCEKINRSWHNEQCWDNQHDPNF